MKTTISFFLQNEHGKRSALWVVDIKDTSDIYIKNNISRKDMHFSQHKSNEAHDTFTSEFIRKHSSKNYRKKILEINVSNYSDFSSACLIWSYRTVGEELNAGSYTPYYDSKKIDLQSNQIAEVFVLRIPEAIFPDILQCHSGSIIKYHDEDELTCVDCVQHINGTHILVAYRLLDYIDVFKRAIVQYKAEPIKEAISKGIVLDGNKLLLLGEIRDRYIFGNEMREQFGHVELYI